MPLVILRHGERLDYVEREAWFEKTPDRQWDPPLSEKGRKQAGDAGVHIRELLEKHDLPPVTRAFSSPLVRCVETAILASCSASGSTPSPAVAPEPSLAENGFKDWYYSWAIPGADGTWGGPKHCRSCEVEVARDQVHKAALLPAGELMLTASDLKSKFGEGNINDCTQFLPSESLSFSWDSPELREDTKIRVGNFALHCHEAFPGETVLLCGHGGGCAMICRHLTNGEAEACGYTGIFILDRQREEDGWKALEKGNVDHLGSGDELGLGTAAKTSSK